MLEHGRGWLGSLQKVVPYSGALFGPGPFLRKAIVYGDAKALKAAAGAPEWATVEEIVFANQSQRAVSPAMKNLRVVGPLSAKDLAPFREGTWRVEEIDFDGAGKESLEALAALRLPLTRLRLRAEKAPPLAALTGAAWWKTLTRLELWLPGSLEDPEAAAGAAFDALAAAIPAGCTLAIGQLTGGQRSGWMLVGGAGAPAKKRHLALLRPDARVGQGTALANAFGLELPDHWDATASEEWLVAALGIAP